MQRLTPIVGALALASGGCLASESNHAAISQSLASRAVFFVDSVTLREAPAQSAIGSDAITAFGRSILRPAEFVSDMAGWDGRRFNARAPRSLCDLDFSTTFGEDNSIVEPVTQLTVLFTRARKDLAAGPDIFLFDTNGEAEAFLVSPVFRMPDDTLRFGEPVLIPGAASAPTLSIVGRSMRGVAVDLDEWARAGLQPPGSYFMGAVVTLPDGGELTIGEVMVGEAPALGGTPAPIAGPGRSVFDSFARGGAGGGGGGSGAPRRGQNEEIPAPGALALAMIAAAAGLKRRRA